MKTTVVCIALVLVVALACASTLNISQGVSSLSNSGTFASKVANLFQKTGQGYNWVGISIVLIVISILINGLIYMVARTFQITYLESAFKLETREAFFNIILILLFGAFSLFLDTLLAAPLLCDTPVNCIVNTSVSYMDGLLSGPMKEASTLESEALKKVSSTNIGGSVGWGGLSVGYTYDMQGLNKVRTLEPEEKIKLLQNAALSLTIVKIFLLYFAYYVGPMLIVFGIMLKSFSITRRLGSTMLAIGLSCAIVLPLTIISILVANGAINIPGVQYMQQAGCPDACTTTIVAWNSSGGIDLNAYMDKAQADTRYPWEERRGIVTGSKDILAISGLGTVYSCEYKNNATNSSMVTKYTALGINANVIAQNITTDCPENCRSIPYPSDVVECRDAERSCFELYAASAPTGPRGACFRKNYDYSNLNYTVVYDGQAMNLSLALNKSACFRVTPLNITGKANPLDYCPSSCRIFYADGSTGCKQGDPNYYNCTKIYMNATGTTDTSLAAANRTVRSVYGNITMELGKTSPNAATITAYASKVSLPIYPVDHPDCLKVMKLPQDLKSAPTYVDCSGCYNEETRKPGAKTEEGKFMAYAVMLGIFSIAITIAAAVAISMGLEGEMFIPGIERLRR
jgi:hypothetical protein